MIEKYQLIQNHPLFISNLKKLQELEADRVFCRHTMEHFLDVARLMYIYTLTEQTGLSRDQIYGAALLHDLGRVMQIEKGTPHDLASVLLAGEILPDCGYRDSEVKEIQDAIGHHRLKEAGEGSLLSLYLQKADKESRICFLCPVREECNWPEYRKNSVLKL